MQTYYNLCQNLTSGLVCGESVILGEVSVPLTISFAP